MTFIFGLTDAIHGNGSMGFDILCKMLVCGEMLGVGMGVC